MGQMTSIIFIVVMFAFLYFFMIRPQKKQQQKHQQMLKQISRGDKVTTIGRLHGVVDEVNEADKTVTLDCDGIYLVFDLSAVARVTPKEGAAAAKPAEPATSEATSEASATDSAADSEATSATEDADSEAK
ncbi:preprotein translocase subunit YajC [Lactiplantibacillus modestisalitolerans]|uniref:Preprotein translocase subunit YajC n=1 Tax=Lactiplantibacillus modestisalitolerans TaxID=1457219 RepID=A0ABV5WWU7_9LACO|nr:preprotein translocase subunit YajC [Lactiplantibacillus modestisalitolerans]